MCALTGADFTGFKRNARPDAWINIDRSDLQTKAAVNAISAWYDVFYLVRCTQHDHCVVASGSPSRGMAMHAFCPARSTAVLTRTRYVENGKHCNRTLIPRQARQRTMNVRAQGQYTATKDNLQTITLPAKDATPENFAPFGQVCAHSTFSKQCQSLASLQQALPPADR